MVVVGVVNVGSAVAATSDGSAVTVHEDGCADNVGVGECVRDCEHQMGRGGG